MIRGEAFLSLNTKMAASMANLQTTLRPSSLPPPPSPSPSRFSIHNRFYTTNIPKSQIISKSTTTNNNKSIRFPVISYCLNSNSTTDSSTLSDETTSPPVLPPVQKKRQVYRKLLPGEAEGIAEEMRFVAMEIRHSRLKVKLKESDESDKEDDNSDGGRKNDDYYERLDVWEPDLIGFVRYLVDSEFVFRSIECMVDESQDVSFAYFRKTGLERSESFRKEIEVFRQQNVQIPTPYPPSKKYVKYLEELAKESPPSFFCHLYNIYFGHVTGGQVIAKQVSEKILGGRELEICKWPGDPEVLLKDMREKLNALGQHWTREVKAKCLTEASRSYGFMGSIIRHIVMK